MLFTDNKSPSSCSRLSISDDVSVSGEVFTPPFPSLSSWSPGLRVVNWSGGIPLASGNPWSSIRRQSCLVPFPTGTSNSGLLDKGGVVKIGVRVSEATRIGVDCELAKLELNDADVGR